MPKMQSLDLTNLFPTRIQFLVKPQNGAQRQSCICKISLLPPPIWDTEKQQLMLTQGLMGAWLTRDLFRKEVETSSGWILCVNIFRKRLTEEMLVTNKVLNGNDLCVK